MIIVNPDRTDTLIVASDANHAPIAFMGVEASKIEMLFVSPIYKLRVLLATT